MNKKASNLLFGFFVFWYVIGFILIAFNILPWYLEWANAVFLVLTGVLGTCYFFDSFKIKGLIFSAFVFVVSILVESLGVHTGAIFGQYFYTNALGFAILGVPVAIGFAWVMVMATSHALASFVLKAKFGATILYVILGSAIAVSMDMVLEPIAFLVNEYWIWQDGGFFYGIPTQNFAGWFLLSALFHTVLYVVILRKDKMFSLQWHKKMALLYAMIVVMFSTLCIISGYGWATIIPLLVTLILVPVSILKNKKYQ